MLMIPVKWILHTQLWLQLRILDDRDPLTTQATLLPSSLAEAITSFVFSDFRQLPCRYFLEFFPLFLHCCLCIWYFHCLRHKNKSVQEIGVTYGIHPLSCNMIFMTLVKRSFHAFPQRFIGFKNTSVFCLEFFNCATGFPVLITLKFARHCGWHRNVQLSTRIFHDILELVKIRINEVNTT